MSEIKDLESAFGDDDDAAKNILDIPSRCRNCPVLGIAAIQLEETTQAKKAMTESSQAALGGIPEESQEQLIAQLKENFNILDSDVEGVVAQIENGIRVSHAEILDHIDKSISDAITDVNAITSACDGLFKMRASRGSTEFTVSICASPNQSCIIDNPVPANVAIRNTAKKTHS